ncbi:pogo transposable, partial [Moniliophthora roreri MCA 2997]
EKELLDLTLENSAHGWPLSPYWLTKHANAILRKQLGPEFEGIGDHWASQYITQYYNHLDGCLSNGLDETHVGAANPITKKEFFDITKKTVQKHNIPEELQYGGDETSIQTGVGVKEYMIGARGKVLPTICADNTELAPIVIFKGEVFQVKWLQNNPLKAQYSYHKKGYMDGEMGVAYIQDFNKQTKAKAKGCAYLLLIDGYISHATYEFLDYTWKNNIYAICYPSHSTHIY